MIHRLISVIMLLISLPVSSAALKPYREKNEKEKAYLNDETRSAKDCNSWKEHKLIPLVYNEKPIRATPQEDAVRCMFATTHNEEIVASLCKDNIDVQEGVLTIIKHFKTGRKFGGWSANGYYSRAAIDCKLVGLCQRVNFYLLGQAKLHVPPTFFHLYNWVRRDCTPPVLEEVAKNSLSVLRDSSIFAIVQILLEHPEKKDEVMFTMLRNVSLDKRSHKMPKSKFDKMYDKKMQIICERAAFQRWAALPSRDLVLSEAIRIAAIRALAASCPARLIEVALEIYQSLLFLDSATHQMPLLIEQCLLESPSLDLYMHTKMYHTPHWEERSLFGDYIYFKHWDIKPEDTFFNVLHKPSDEEFQQIIDALRKTSSFQSVLYGLSIPHLQSDDERLKAIHDAALEIQIRINSWADVLSVHMTNKCRLKDVYSRILHAASAKATSSDDKQMKGLLLDIFRSAHCFFYECEQAGYSADKRSCYDQDKNFGSLLARLMALGIKPNTALCPSNPEDNRTLFSAYMFMREPSAEMLTHACCAWDALSEEERCAEAMHWRKSYEVARSFETYSKSLVKIAKEDVQLLAFIESLVIASRHADAVSKSLLERLIQV